MIILDNFSYSSIKMYVVCCGGTSNEYSQHIFLWNSIKKIIPKSS